MKFNIITGRLSRILIIIACLFTVMPENVFAQEATASLEKDEILMGTTTEMKVRIPLPNDTVAVEFPLLQEALSKKKSFVSLLNDTVELRSKYKREIIREDDKTWMTYDLTIQAFDSGAYTLPPLTFLVGNEPVNTNSINLKVIPVKASADDKIDDFSDVAQPFELNPNPEEMDEEGGWPWWIWLLIGLAALVLIGAIILFFIFRKNGNRLPFIKKQPVYVQALNKLSKLKSQNLPTKGKTKEYYTRLTDILRWYLRRQYGIKTLERTSAEILSETRDIDKLSNNYEILKSIFDTADFVKFAKVNPSEAENLRCMAESELFIHNTKFTIDEMKEGGKS